MKAPAHITSIAENEVFVFGSNLAGIHGAGAAAMAHRKFGAAWGVGLGLTGQCYAIATKDEHIHTLPLEQIGWQVGLFLRYAERNPDKTFLVTAIGCGLAGYSESEIAPLFRMFGKIPANVALPVEWGTP